MLSHGRSSFLVRARVMRKAQLAGENYCVLFTSIIWSSVARLQPWLLLLYRYTLFTYKNKTTGIQRRYFLKTPPRLSIVSPFLIPQLYLFYFFLRYLVNFVRLIPLFLCFNSGRAWTATVAPEAAEWSRGRANCLCTSETQHNQRSSGRTQTAGSRPTQYSRNFFSFAGHRRLRKNTLLYFLCWIKRSESSVCSALQYMQLARKAKQ